MGVALVNGVLLLCSGHAATLNIQSTVLPDHFKAVITGSYFVLNNEERHNNLEAQQIYEMAKMKLARQANI